MFLESPTGMQRSSGVIAGKPYGGKFLCNDDNDDNGRENLCPSPRSLYVQMSSFSPPIGSDCLYSPRKAAFPALSSIKGNMKVILT